MSHKLRLSQEKMGFRIKMEDQILFSAPPHLLEIICPSVHFLWKETEDIYALTDLLQQNDWGF